MLSKEAILKYWSSWAERNDVDEMRSCLADDLTHDGGTFSFRSADEFYEVCKKGNKWTGIIMLDTIFDENRGAIIYEGTDSVTGQTYRVSEFCEVNEEGKISSIIASMTVISKQN